jgi:hypothetical protein
MKTDSASLGHARALATLPRLGASAPSCFPQRVLRQQPPAYLQKQYEIYSKMSGGLGKLGRIYRRKTHVLPFVDHAGKEALMVFSGRETCPLPPLYSFHIYFTHQDVKPENVQPAELLKALVRDTPYDAYGCPYRLELHFLPMPSADAQECDEACMAHYLEEKRHRGDYKDQIVGFENSLMPSGSLPGFVPSYIQVESCEYLRSLLFCYQGANWRTDKQPARRISFDSLPEEELDVLDDEVKEEVGVDGVLPPVYVTLQFFQESDTEWSVGPAYAGEHMFYISNADTQNMTNGPYHEAVERGWQTW